MNQSELILNPDGSIYHLNLLPTDVANNVILVGDPDRVPMVSQFFDEVTIKKQKREFTTHTGKLQGKSFTVISTGIGTDNIDIVMNELDALLNIDMNLMMPKPNPTSINFVRIGTSGSLTNAIALDSFLLSQKAIGFDGLMCFYSDNSHQDLESIKSHFPKLQDLLYQSQASNSLAKVFESNMANGTTATLPGFYGPQGRTLRLTPSYPNFLDQLSKLGISNFEMETAGIYALANALGHQAVSLNAIIANRENGTFSAEPKSTIHKLIQYALDCMVQSKYIQ